MDRTETTPCFDEPVDALDRTPGIAFRDGRPASRFTVLVAPEHLPRTEGHVGRIALRLVASVGG